MEGGRGRILFCVRLNGVFGHLCQLVINYRKRQSHTFSSSQSRNVQRNCKQAQGGNDETTGKLCLSNSHYSDFGI